MKRRVIIDLVTEVEENEPPSLLYDDIRQELCCCWHDVSFTMKHEDVDEPQIFICPIQNDYEALIEDEPQTETEIAKAIVHKAIDDAVIAEDAYPDLRQKMHDAVDEYEPQTDCAWK